MKCAGQQSECSFREIHTHPIIGNSEEEGDFKSENIKREREQIQTKNVPLEEKA